MNAHQVRLAVVRRDRLRNALWQGAFWVIGGGLVAALAGIWILAAALLVAGAAAAWLSGGWVRRASDDGYLRRLGDACSRYFDVVDGTRGPARRLAVKQLEELERVEPDGLLRAHHERLLEHQRELVDTDLNGPERLISYADSRQELERLIEQARAAGDSAYADALQRIRTRSQNAWTGWQKDWESSGVGALARVRELRFPPDAKAGHEALVDSLARLVHEQIALSVASDAEHIHAAYAGWSAAVEDYRAAYKEIMRAIDWDARWPS